MSSPKKIESALLSVYHKDNLAPVVRLLREQGVKLYSTGGTQSFIEQLGMEVTAVEHLTGHPSILGGRVKTLHPKVFGGILYRREVADDRTQVAEYGIPAIDLVLVDLYPFEETVASGAGEEDVIEQIDIGGVSLLRAAAKNYRDVLVVSSRAQYGALEELLRDKEGFTDLADRREFAQRAFAVTARYDAAIGQYLGAEVAPSPEPDLTRFRALPSRPLRYGENPHQQARFYGDLGAMFEQLNGKELSYNNLVDVDAAVALINEFGDAPGETTFAILKHTNACGIATATTAREAYRKAFAADPVSAFGGVLITNAEVDGATAGEVNQLFFEVLIAPAFHPDALEVLLTKKNRIILRRKPVATGNEQFKTLLNGVIEQDKDLTTEKIGDLRPVTRKEPSDAERKDLVFSLKVAKHTKSNTIVLARKGCLLASGVGQTSRVDALKQAIEKARASGFELQGAVMASDAFFPFPDCVEIAHRAGITAVVQPGGSIKDADSIRYCDDHGLAMVFTGIRHFKH
ncbi:MAG: bifunctional phosphoribosylaminoimidazolecarboxamide formyltransferase/IMP cyclohydrolase [Ferruginibacter sp.]|nr:bifunctional phosphoribosylaminoimidazolecarboxamide formyltransferase/IMP cyclohydrolase [Cytophagales bacterium]